MPGGQPRVSRSHLATVARLGVVTAVLDLGDLLWISHSTGWLLVILISAFVFGTSVALRRTRPATALALAGLGYAVTWVISLSEPRPVPTMAQAALRVAVFSTIVSGTARLRLTGVITLGTCVAGYALAVASSSDVATGAGTFGTDALSPTRCRATVSC